MIDTSLSLGDGSPSSPALAFNAALNTGFYRDGAGIGVMVGGVLAGRFGAAGFLPANGPVAVTGAGLAATVNAPSAVVTTESLATAAGSTFAYVITNSAIKAGSNVLVTVGFGSATTGIPCVQKVAVIAGQVTVTVLNVNATGAASLNGSMVIGLLVQ